MKSFATNDFWQLYKNLSPDLKQKVKATYKLWQTNSLHPSLHFKKVGKNLWSVRITNDYRALAIKKGDDYYWFWVGNHHQYDNILN
jgi:hypothetical protein